MVEIAYWLEGHRRRAHALCYCLTAPFGAEKPLRVAGSESQGRQREREDRLASISPPSEPVRREGRTLARLTESQVMELTAAGVTEMSSVGSQPVAVSPVGLGVALSRVGLGSALAVSQAGLWLPVS